MEVGAAPGRLTCLEWKRAWSLDNLLHAETIRQHSRRKQRRFRGLTLVEVVAALVILGVLLALLVKAAGQSNHQRIVAEQRLAAAREVDRLIAGWMAGDRPVRAGLAGGIAGPPALYWSTSEVPDREAVRLGTKIIRLSVYPAQPAADRAEMGSDIASPARQPVLSIDLLAPAALWREAPTTAPNEQEAATRPADGEDREDPRLLEPPAFVRRN